MPIPTSRRAATAAATLLTVALAGVFAGACHGRGPEQRDPAIFTWNGDLKAPGTLHLRNVNGSIEVRPSRDSAVHVMVGAAWTRGDPKTDLKFDVVSTEHDVTVCIIWGKGSCDEHNYTTGPSVFGLGRKSTDATTVLTVEVPARVRVDAITVNGLIDVAATAPVRAINVNGSIKVATAIGPVDAVTVNGSVDVRMTTIGNDTGVVRAETVNGTAKAYLPADVDANYDLTVMNGEIGSDFSALETPKTRSQSGVLGKGGRRLTVKAMNGSAFMRKLNADGTPTTKP